MIKDDVKKALDETIDVLNNVDNGESCKKQIEIARSIVAGILTAYKNDYIVDYKERGIKNMENLINLLDEIRFNDTFPAFPIPTKFLTDVQNCIHETSIFTYKPNKPNFSQSKLVSKDDVRLYLQRKSIYSNEEELEIIMRDINTPLLFIDSAGFRILLRKYLKKALLTEDGQYNKENIKMLTALGFRCYPFKYIESTYVLGIITPKGHIIFNPLQ